MSARQVGRESGGVEGAVEPVAILGLADTAEHVEEAVGAPDPFPLEGLEEAEKVDASEAPLETV